MGTFLLGQIGGEFHDKSNNYSKHLALQFPLPTMFTPQQLPHNLADPHTITQHGRMDITQCQACTITMVWTLCMTFVVFK